MIVAIVGSREYPNQAQVQRFVAQLAKKYSGVIVVSGGARGVDTWAEERAISLGLGVISYRPYEYENMAGRQEWSIETHTWGERAQEIVVAKRRRISPPFFPTFAQAAFHRNGWIDEDGEQIVAFWDGSSRGTADTVNRAYQAGKTPHVYRATMVA